MRTVLLTTIVLSLTLISNQARSQSPIEAFSTSYISSSGPAGYSNKPAPGSGSFSGCGTTTFTYTFNKGSNNLLKLHGITANSKNYFISNITSAIVKIRRVDNAGVSGNRAILSLEAYSGPTTNCPGNLKIELRVPYQDNMENFLNTNYINQGTDNIFTNAGNGDGNINNIERVDILFPAGLSTIEPTNAGFAIFDRGVNKGHDGFRIAAITSLDSNGDPASFGMLKTCTKGNGSTNGSWGHPTLANGNKTFSVYAMRKEGADANLRVSAAINQEVGGVFFSFDDLGIAPGQVVYGYAVFATDGLANPTQAQMLSISNSSMYPTNTTESNGGLDMMAINAVFSTGGDALSSNEIQLQANVSGNNVMVKWQFEIAGRSGIELQRSKNGVDFTTVYFSMADAGMVDGSFGEQAKGNSISYRMKIKPFDGPAFYSMVIRVEIRNVQFIVFPTVITGGQPLNVKGLKDGNYNVILSASDGKFIRKEVRIQNGNGVIQTGTLNLKGIVYMNFFDINENSFPGKKLLFE